MHRAACLCALLALAATAQEPANLLRNASFQDDWATHLLETKNHHWSYSSEYQNRRDYNPDGWWCKGSWEWQNADAAPGDRRLVLRGPRATVTQRVNWVMVHDDRKKEGFPDAGGFPHQAPQRSRTPLALVRDLTLRVTLTGTDVPADAGTVEVAYCPPGAIAVADPYGTVVAPTAAASAPLPPGTYERQVVEVKLAAADWLAAAQAAAAKNPKEAEEVAKAGLVLPATASVTLLYRGATGSVTVLATALAAAPSPASNLLANGHFEYADEHGYPAGWSAPAPYGYFPPGAYYMFNTWHNHGAAPRGPVEREALIARGGGYALKMIVAAGDQQAVTSAPIALNQKEPRLIEVSAWVKTDHLNFLQIDARDEQDRRLDGFNFINKAPISFGTDEWRLLRQVFRPREPVQTLRLVLAVRGVNGYTLDDTGTQPQNNVVGTVWWDDVQVCEPESTEEELTARNVTRHGYVPDAPQMPPPLSAVDFGERLLGANVLRATVWAPGREPRRLRLALTPPGQHLPTVYTSAVLKPGRDGLAAATLPYTIAAPCPNAYTEYRARLSVVDARDQVLARSDLWWGTWTTPVDLELGALYLLPEQPQFVRLNLGLAAATMAKVGSVRLEVLRRGTGEVLKTWTLAATPAAIAAQREKLPVDLREDLTNLLLTDLDVSFLPPQPFNDPQRNWSVCATVLDTAGQPLAGVAPVRSTPFCRLAHEPPQPAITAVSIKRERFYVNGQPWMPWGAVYGHIPVYDGPADHGPGKYRDLHNLPGWPYYDRFGPTYNRKRNDYNCLRYVASYGKTTDPKLPDTLAKHWTEDNLYCSTFFIVPNLVWSPAEAIEKAGGQEAFDRLAAFAKSAPMVASVCTGVEEVFGTFHAATAEQLQSMGETVAFLRERTARPVMVGHGGAWNRFEFEKVPYFDIYDPETEPLYPAALHVDLAPLLRGRDAVIWLRPQMYEDVPYERWRYHTFVEMMRGCRGWQMAHGPGDQSTARGLHGEMEFMKPILFSDDAGPAVSITPWLEHWSRRHAGKTYIVAATTLPLRVGAWEWSEEVQPPSARSRMTGEMAAAPGAPAPAERPFRFHGVQYLPNPVGVPTGVAAELVQWVKLDPANPPATLGLILKTEGRWRGVAGWGGLDLSRFRADLKLAHRFLRDFYRNAPGVIGWGYDEKLLTAALPYIPGEVSNRGALPAAGDWVRLAVPLADLGGTGVTIDGVAGVHDGGRVFWGRTVIALPDGTELELFGERLTPAPDALAQTRITVAGLKAGTPVRVVFEDRTLTTSEGYFTDDFRGADLYQRHGGASGYGIAPVAFHVYEVP